MSPTPRRGSLEDLAYIDERRAEPGVEIGIGELNDGDDPPVDLLAKKGLAERLDVSHDLLRRLVATSQDVYFFDVAAAGDDPRGLDSVDATDLVLERDQGPYLISVQSRREAYWVTRPISPCSEFRNPLDCALLEGSYWKRGSRGL